MSHIVSTYYLRSVCEDRRGNSAIQGRAERELAALLAQLDALRDAVFYTLDRAQVDPDLGYLLGWGTEAFHRLCAAEAAITGKTVDEVAAKRNVDLQPAHRKRDPEVLVLRKRVEELEAQIASERTR